MDPLPAGIGIVTESPIEIGIVTAGGEFGRRMTSTISATGTECASLSAPAEWCQPLTLPLGFFNLKIKFQMFQVVIMHVCKLCCCLRVALILANQLLSLALAPGSGLLKDFPYVLGNFTQPCNILLYDITAWGIA